MPDITYHGRDEVADCELFRVRADGVETPDGVVDRRDVMELIVDASDRIWVAAVAPYGPPTRRATSGRAHRHTVVGGTEPVVCLGSVMEYAYPRLGTLMARVYCPADVVASAESR